LDKKVILTNGGQQEVLLNEKWQSKKVTFQEKRGRVVLTITTSHPFEQFSYTQVPNQCSQAAIPLHSSRSILLSCIQKEENSRKELFLDVKCRSWPT
jgi:hypothetical protein